jgi:hypothetical protein
MKLFSGIKLTIPLEWIAKMTASTFNVEGSISISKGAKYPLAGEWWVVSEVDSKGIRLEPADKSVKIREEVPR